MAPVFFKSFLHNVVILIIDARVLPVWDGRFLLFIFFQIFIIKVGGKCGSLKDEEEKKLFFATGQQLLRLSFFFCVNAK